VERYTLPCKYPTILCCTAQTTGNENSLSHREQRVSWLPPSGYEHTRTLSDFSFSGCKEFGNENSTLIMSVLVKEGPVLPCLGIKPCKHTNKEPSTEFTVSNFRFSKFSLCTRCCGSKASTTSSPASSRVVKAVWPKKLLTGDSLPSSSNTVLSILHTIAQSFRFTLFMTTPVLLEGGRSTWKVLKAPENVAGASGRDINDCTGISIDPNNWVESFTSNIFRHNISNLGKSDMKLNFVLMIAPSLNMLLELIGCTPTCPLQERLPSNTHLS